MGELGHIIVTRCKIVYLRSVRSQCGYWPVLLVGISWHDLSNSARLERSIISRTNNSSMLFDGSQGAAIDCDFFADFDM